MIFLFKDIYRQGGACSEDEVTGKRRRSSKRLNQAEKEVIEVRMPVDIPAGERSHDVEDMEVDRVELAKDENAANDGAKIEAADTSITQPNDFSEQSITTSGIDAGMRSQQMAPSCKDGEVSSNQIDVVSNAEEYNAPDVTTTTNRVLPMETLIDVNVESGEVSVLKHSRLLETEAGGDNMERKVPIESKTDVDHQDAVNRDQGIFTIYFYVL